MIAALLFVAWTGIAVGVGLVIGRVIRVADEREAAQRKAQQCPAYVPGSWVA